MWTPRPVDVAMVGIWGALILLREAGYLGGPIRPGPRMSVAESCLMVVLFSAVILFNSLGIVLF